MMEVSGGLAPISRAGCAEGVGGGLRRALSGEEAESLPLRFVEGRVRVRREGAWAEL